MANSKITTKGPVKMDYPIDKSSKGTPGNSPAKLKGSPSNLSHSLEGVSAHQGRSKGGKENGFD